MTGSREITLPDSADKTVDIVGLEKNIVTLLREVVR